MPCPPGASVNRPMESTPCITPHATLRPSEPSSLVSFLFLLSTSPYYFYSFITNPHFTLPILSTIPRPPTPSVTTHPPPVHPNNDHNPTYSHTTSKSSFHLYKLAGLANHTRISLDRQRQVHADSFRDGYRPQYIVVGRYV